MQTPAAKQKEGARIIASLSAAVVVFTFVAPHVSPSWKPFEDGITALIFVLLRMTGMLGFLLSLWFLDRGKGGKNR